MNAAHLDYLGQLRKAFVRDRVAMRRQIERLGSIRRLPEANDVEVYMRDYDAASKATESCDVLYPDCNDALADVDSPTFSY